MWANMRSATVCTRTQESGAPPVSCGRQQDSTNPCWRASSQAPNPWWRRLVARTQRQPGCRAGLSQTGRNGSGRILRLYESTGQTVEVEVHGFPPGCRVWETTVTEDKLRECHAVDGRVRLTFRPWQVMTLLAEE